ncbi:C40 family peptidase [Spongiactinospora rosea]|uniref:C40 family peptidase n=1 Tax=Spongiactinospora rosea TaxID=2248750 RepID=UPI0013149F5E|nr:C40 family peptidase [Spongiactinospora rosea]
MKYAAVGAALLLLIGLFIAAAGSILTSSGGPGCLITPGPDSSQQSLGTLDEEQKRNATLIIQAALHRDLPTRAAVIAVATALQESRLRNATYGHLDSLGLFQQRPSQGWGSPEQILDPAYATSQFYDRLVKIPRWERLPLAHAAQAVQRSAFPNAYTKWEPLSQRLVDAVAGFCVVPVGGEGVSAVLAYAHAQLGKPYIWGAEGPAAFDCSGLTMRAYQAAGLNIPRVAADQWRYGPPVPRGQEKPGDLVFFRMYRGEPQHVGLVIGNRQMIHAPNSRDVVKIASYQWPDLVGFTRPMARKAARLTTTVELLDIDVGGTTEHSTNHEHIQRRFVMGTPGSHPGHM